MRQNANEMKRYSRILYMRVIERVELAVNKLDSDKKNIFFMRWNVVHIYFYGFKEKPNTQL